MSSEKSDSSCALAIAVSALAAISLFWAVVLIAVLLNQGPSLAQTLATSTDSNGGLKPTDITGGLTALCALAVASGSLWLTRRHNRLSVRPKISVVQVIDNSDNKKIGLYLRNHGLGPALIEEISFEVRNGPILRSFQNLRMFLFANNKYYFIPKELGALWLEVLPKDACEGLLWLESKETNAAAQFKRLLSDLRLVVQYRSFYGEKEVEVHDPMVPPRIEPLDPMSLFIDPMS
jgi:hypothetical protein